jgi:hypothetical protein
MKKNRPLYNCLDYDFLFEWFDDKNEVHILKIPSLDIAYFPEGQYEFMKKHLLDDVIEQRGVKNGNYELSRKMYEKEVVMDDFE